MVIDPARFTDDHFALFGLPRQQALDTAELSARYQELVSQTHPDRHAHLSQDEQRRAMQWTTRINEAYATLKDPLRRAIYLLHLAGVDAALETNTAMPAEFLIAQMEAREAVEEARRRHDVEFLDAHHGKIRHEIAEHHRRLVQALDSGTHEEAARLVRQLMFEEKLLAEIDAALAEIEG